MDALDSVARVDCTSRLMARRVLITVAEFSGDHHAANLIREVLRKLDPEIIVDAPGRAEFARGGGHVAS